ncbi:MAG: hypothetical protein LBQ51_10535 [Desulfovibrio sp.]|jgi:uncharacterized protein (TIGR00661 family)|nr:hypothetical protein [Desulfovibrio sp.]
MARILYGVQGDANGHISRALAAAELFSGHEWLFAGGGAAAQARDAGHAYEALPMIATEVRGNRVRILPSLLNMGRVIAGRDAWVRKVGEIIRSFDPDLILIDYEYFIPRAANALGRHWFSLDHLHMIVRSQAPRIAGQTPARLMMTTAMRVYMPAPERCLLVSFHAQPLLYPLRDELFAPLPRSDAVSAGVASAGHDPGGHALVYLPGCDLGAIIASFGSRRREFKIYGHGARPASGNLSFRPAGRESFLEDLASCAYVVSYGGHGLLSEALFLGKPCLCLPLRFQYEQHWNAYFVQQNGYGRYLPSFDIPPRALDAFEHSLEDCSRRITAGNFDGRQRLRQRLGALLGDTANAVAC